MIVSTGTEILQGLYPDTNACYLADKLSAMGLNVVGSTASPDDEQYLEPALRHAMQLADLVLCTGGLGPTEDDINRHVFARLWGMKLVANEQALHMMQARFKARGRGEMPASNSVQALIPENSTILQNEWGTAPGFFVPPVSGKPALIALPGPPKEMKPMFEKYAAAVLQPYMGGQSFSRIRTLHTFGQPESHVNDCCRDLFRSDPKIVLTILARPFGIDLRLRAMGSTAAEADEHIAAMEQQIRQRVDESELYGTDEETLADSVAALLIAGNSTIAAAESCTGGLVAKLLTDVPGSSTYLNQSHVVYSNEAKSAVVGVREETLITHGAVSPAVASELAEGVRRLSASTIGIGVTGIAGPTGATEGKPVGLTYIGVSDMAGCDIERFQFGGDREQNRLWAAQSALWMVRKRLLAGR